MMKKYGILQQQKNNLGAGKHLFGKLGEKYLDRDAKVSQLFLIKWYKPDEIYSCSTKHFFYILQMNCDSN